MPRELVVLNIRFPIPPQRLVLLDALGIAVFALVLVEQLLRNVSTELRWSIKPLCLGLGGAVLFDLYLFSDALPVQSDRCGRLQYSRIRACAGCTAGGYLNVAQPRLEEAGTVPARAALQSATLVSVGVRLLFMSAAGYYVRYFGGEWGRALQLALLFAALLLLGVLSLSGSMRAKFRVLIGKHFSYRYDYREEWLRFTNTLSSQDGFSEMGKHVIKRVWRIWWRVRPGHCG